MYELNLSSVYELRIQVKGTLALGIRVTFVRALNSFLSLLSDELLT